MTGMEIGVRFTQAKKVSLIISCIIRVVIIITVGGTCYNYRIDYIHAGCIKYIYGNIRNCTYYLGCQCITNTYIR